MTQDESPTNRDAALVKEIQQGFTSLRWRRVLFGAGFWLLAVPTPILALAATLVSFAATGRVTLLQPLLNVLFRVTGEPKDPLPDAWSWVCFSIGVLAAVTTLMSLADLLSKCGGRLAIVHKCRIELMNLRSRLNEATTDAERKRISEDLRRLRTAHAEYF